MSRSHEIGMLSFAKDLPNICSLLGLLCAVFGVYFAHEGYFVVSIITLLWAVLFDLLDGVIARKMKGRTKAHGIFGSQLDSMIDIVSFGIYPAILLLSYANYSAWFVPGAFIIIAANAIRLSYFNVYGLIDSKTYMGLSVDNNGIIIAFAFLFESFFSQFSFSLILYALLLTLSAFNLASIPMPKLTGRWIYILVGYVLVMTSIFAWILLSR